jgi:hypothetical protein
MARRDPNRLKARSRTIVRKAQRARKKANRRILSKTERTRGLALRGGDDATVD